MQVVPAFDAHHPPAQSLLDECIHCGFCLPACPTYELFGEEMDSPRGRIELMRAGVHGTPLSESMVRHLDLCLGCMACATACPSGVHYGELLSQTRQQLERRWRRPLGQRLLRSAVFALFPHPRRLRPLVAGLRRYQESPLPRLVHTPLVQRLLPPLVRQLESIAPSPPPARRQRSGAPGSAAAQRPGTAPERLAASGARRLTVGLVRGCVQSSFFPQVTVASAHLLATAGCEVAAPENQSCCGALSAHVGREEEARRFARAMIDRFAPLGVDRVVVDAAGCGSALKEYGKLLADDPRYAQRAAAFAASVRDLSEQLAELSAAGEPAAPAPAPAPATTQPLRVAYQDACHLAHAQGIRAQPRQLLAAVPGVELVELEDQHCCGSAGIYNLLEIEPARRLGDRKAETVLRTDADIVVTANPGCLLQIRASLARAGSDLPVVHVAELLDAARLGELDRLVGRRRHEVRATVPAGRESS